jgi:hypothetical protein
MNWVIRPMQTHDALTQSIERESAMRHVRPLIIVLLVALTLDPVAGFAQNYPS